MQRASSARWKTLDRRFLLRLFVWSLCQRALTKPVSYNYRWSRQLRAASTRAASTTTRTITMIAATTTITATTTNKRRGVRPPCDVLLCKFNDVVDVKLVRSHEREAPAASVGGEFVPWYLKVSTGEPPDKPRDIWKCQSDKYGSCVVVMQSAPSLTNPSSFHARVVVLPAAFPWALSLSLSLAVPIALSRWKCCGRGRSIRAGDGVFIAAWTLSRSRNDFAADLREMAAFHREK